MTIQELALACVAAASLAAGFVYYGVYLVVGGL